MNYSCWRDKSCSIPGPLPALRPWLSVAVAVAVVVVVAVVVAVVVVAVVAAVVVVAVVVVVRSVRVSGDCGGKTVSGECGRENAVRSEERAAAAPEIVAAVVAWVTHGYWSEQIPVEVSVNWQGQIEHPVYRNIQ